MKKLIIVATAFAISSSAAFAQSIGFANPNGNAYLFSNNAQATTADAQPQHHAKVRHVATKSFAKSAATKQTSRM